MAIIEYALKLEPTGREFEYRIHAERRTQGGVPAKVGEATLAHLGTLVGDLKRLHDQTSPGLTNRDEEFIERYGRALFRQAFGEALLQRLTDDLPVLRGLPTGRNRYLAIRVDDPSALSGAAWEMMFWDHPDHPHFLCRNPLISLVRSNFMPRHYDLPAVELPLRVLVVVSLPRDRVPLNARAEIDALLKPLKQMIGRGEIEVDFVQGEDTLRRVLALMESGNYHVMHFIGHGEEQGGQVQLVLTDANHNAALMGWDTLWLALQGFPAPRLVVLNVCGGAARLGGASPFSSLAGVFVNARIPAVVAHKTAITDESAGRFAANLYRCIIKGLPVDYAVARARQELEGVEWQTPVLFLQSATADIFTVPLRREAQAVDQSQWPRKAEHSKSRQRWAEVASYAQEALLINPDDTGSRNLRSDALADEGLDQCLHEMQFAASEQVWAVALRWCQAYLKNERATSPARAAENERVTFCEVVARVGLGSAGQRLQWRS